jgi:hypothetical protein
MKNKPNIMKLKIILFLTIILLFSCSSDDNTENQNLNQTSEAYIYSGQRQKLIKVNLINSSITEVSNSFSSFDSDFTPIYFQPSNEIIGIDSNYNLNAMMDNYRIVKINLSNGNVSFVNLIQNNRYSPLCSFNNKIYSYNSTKNKLVEINPSNGNETDFSNVFFPFDGQFYGSYLSSTNEMITVDSNYSFTTNQDNYRLIKVNMTNGSVSYIDLLDNLYAELVIVNNKIYAYNSDKNRIVEINSSNGSETNFTNTFSVFDNDFVPKYNLSTNEIIGIDDENNKIIKVNMSSGIISTINIENSNYGDIVIKN